MYWGVLDHPKVLRQYMTILGINFGLWLRKPTQVQHVANGFGALDGREQPGTCLRRAFLRELEAMIRLRSLNTINVYGTVASLPDRTVLVMELLAGGDLLTLLRTSETPLPEEQSRRIIGDICAGMAFLHGKNTTHGDLKSADVLLDGDGRAKVTWLGNQFVQTSQRQSRVRFLRYLLVFLSPRVEYLFCAKAKAIISEFFLPFLHMRTLWKTENSVRMLVHRWADPSRTEANRYTLKRFVRDAAATKVP